jgi:hypothetical protein
METIKKKMLVVFLTIILFYSCLPTFEDTLRCKEIVSSKGEKIYVKSINWGATGDYQATIITCDIEKMKTRSDTTGSVNILAPFLYRFKDDTLTLVFSEEKNYEIKEKFKTVKIKYTVVESSDFWKMKNEPEYLLP